MPRIEELISEKSKSKIMKFVGDNSKPIKGASSVKEMFLGDSSKPIKNVESVKELFIGQTPNLNSSLGVNAAIGDPEAAPSGGTTPSKFSTFVEKNQGLLTSIGGALFGPKTSTTPTYTPPPVDEPKKIMGMSQGLFWGLIIVVIIIAIVIIVKVTKKK